MLEKDPKNIFCYELDVENYTDQVVNFSVFDKHAKYSWNLPLLIPVSVFMLRVNVTLFVPQDLIDRIQE